MLSGTEMKTGQLQMVGEVNLKVDLKKTTATIFRNLTRRYPLKYFYTRT